MNHRRLSLCVLLVLCALTSGYAQHFAAGRNGDAHYFFDRDGKLYTWGRVEYAAADGLNREGRTLTPVEVKHPEGKQWKKGVNDGWVVLLDHDGDAFFVADKLTRVVSFDGENKWKDVSDNHNTGVLALISETGKLYYKGRLFTSTAASPQRFINFDTLSLFPMPPDGSLWHSVVAGGYHTLAITTSGSIYGFGDNTFGQLGSGDTIFRPTPTLMLHPNTDLKPKWKQVALWHRVSLALDELGNLYYCGTYNIFEPPGTNEKLSLQKITNPKNEKWTQITISGHDQVLALTETGALYAWGWLEKNWGPFGESLRKSMITVEPREVQTPENVIRWSNIGTLVTTCYAIDEQCRIWGWGRTYSGEMGFDPGSVTDVDTPTLVHTFCQNLEARPSPSVDELILAYRLYPNPVTDHLELNIRLVRSADLSIEIIDLLGNTRIVHDRKSLPSGENTIPLNLAKLPTGTYYVRISSQSSITKTVRIVKN